VSRARRSDERGQALVISVLFLAVLIGMAGLVVDVGAWYVQHQKAQAAADFGALAAAAELPSRPTNARSMADDYVDENLPGATAETTLNYDGDPRKVEVKAKTKGDTYFLRLFGWETVDISARAVAHKVASAVPLAIFAYDDRCSEFGFGANGDNMNINGGIHSNGTFKTNGNDFTAAGARAGGPNDCEPYVNGARIKFGDDDAPTPEPELQDWPRYYYESEFPCTYTAQKFEFNRTPQTIPDGVYCATESFKANGNNQTGNITVLAPEIVVNGDNQRFTPYMEGLLFYATGTKDLMLDGNNFNWTGTIFHPRGRVKINGDQYSILNGLIEGLHVEVNGNGFTMNGTGPNSEDSIALIE
jgi:hypothetical protein